MKPLAACLALALAFGGTTAAAAWTPAERGALRDRLGPIAPPPMKPYTYADAAPWLAARHRDRPPRTPAPAGVSVPVTNCDDAGPGSLRDAIDNVAVDGNTIDLSALTCSTITLTSGSLLMTQDNLTLEGPSATDLAISGNDTYSVAHVGFGTLTLNSVSIRHGSKYYDASATTSPKGGCLYSAGSVVINDALFSYCGVGTANTSVIAVGGAIYARGSVTLADSQIVLSKAGVSGIGGSGPGYGGAIASIGPTYLFDSGIGFNQASASGGGVVALGGFLSLYSQIASNAAMIGGGAFAGNNVIIRNSTVAVNEATVAGGLYLVGTGANAPLQLTDSTISGNTAQAVGGVVVGYPAEIANSTIAFNVETNASDRKYGAGLYLTTPIDLESSIVTNNELHLVAGDYLADDIGGRTGASISGANNMAVWVLSPLAPPPDTLAADPGLQPLAYNGGITATHALVAGSVAIDAGNNVAGLSYDQRGHGFPRRFGATVDIGAYEFNDTIFADGFDP
ncbi:MAG TPA: choice-of-anchor Q domain-containing protein [Rhodanobacteraceae bacterium]